MGKHADSDLFTVNNLFARILFLSLFFIFFVELILFAAAAVAIQFSGIVVDPQGHPIDRATVRLLNYVSIMLSFQSISRHGKMVITTVDNLFQPKARNTP